MIYLSNTAPFLRSVIGIAAIDGRFLIISLFNIAIPTEHLAIFRHSLAALRPGNNMVAVHFLKFKFLVAQRTNMLLPFVSGQFIPSIKTADRQQLFLGNIDDLKPFQLFTFRTVADVNEKLVV